MAKGENFEDLVDIMDRLRGPEGCPWDREQTFETLRGYLLEECYEVLEAIENDDPDALRDELGDLLFQIVFLSRLAKENEQFTVDDVVLGIRSKIVRRHPHVFGDAQADSPEEVWKTWDEIKRRERSTGEGNSELSALSGIPRALPALKKALALGNRAARVGFDWPDRSHIERKIREELSELRQAARDDRPDGIREELGDLLFSIVMLGRRLEVDAEDALQAANRKFRHRFESMEAELRRRGTTLEKAGVDLMNRVWDDIKSRE